MLSSRSSPTRRIILVEADPEFRRLLIALLSRRCGVVVTLAETLPEAVGLLLESPNEISHVVLDRTSVENLSEQLLSDYLSLHSEIHTQFILFTSVATPEWPGHYVKVINKNEIKKLIATIALPETGPSSSRLKDHPSKSDSLE